MEELNASGFGQNIQDIEMTEQTTDKDENSNFEFGASAIGH
jgi:hypothetical protein